MRYSSRPGEAGYAEYQAAGPLRIFFEGAEITGVVMADEDARMIEQVCFDEAGRLLIHDDGESFRTAIRYGHVRVERMS
jgi:hypothetical protein